MQQGQLGQLGQQMRGTDIQRLTALGGQEQALQQAILDAQRQSNLQQQQFPYQQYAFLSDIYRGTPSSQSVTTMSQTPDPSVAQQIAGLGIAGLGAAKGGASNSKGYLNDDTLNRPLFRQMGGPAQMTPGSSNGPYDAGRRGSGNGWRSDWSRIWLTPCKT